MTFAKAYQQLFDNFVQERNIDLDDRYWTNEQRTEWAGLFAKLQTDWDRQNLLGHEVSSGD